jgi:hypothetical protein
MQASPTIMRMLNRCEEGTWLTGCCVIALLAAGCYSPTPKLIKSLPSGKPCMIWRLAGGSQHKSLNSTWRSRWRRSPADGNLQKASHAFVEYLVKYTRSPCTFHAHHVQRDKIHAQKIQDLYLPHHVDNITIFGCCIVVYWSGEHLNGDCKNTKYEWYLNNKHTEQSRCCMQMDIMDLRAQILRLHFPHMSSWCTSTNKTHMGASEIDVWLWGFASLVMTWYGPPPPRSLSCSRDILMNIGQS